MRLNSSRIMEILKILLAVSFGFSIRTITDMSTTKLDCSECPQRDMGQDSLGEHDIQIQLRERFKPKTMYEVIRYDYFNNSFILNNFDDEPKIGLLGHQKSDIKDIVHQSLTLFNSGKSKRWHFKRIINGYRRFDALRGEEYILDLELSEPDTVDMRGIVRTESFRFDVVKPFTVPQMLHNQRLNSNRMIHFILPVSGAAIERFEIFIKNFEDVCLKTKEHVYLMVVLFTAKTGVLRSRGDAIKNTVEMVKQKYRHAHIRLVQTQYEFNRALGLDIGAKQLRAESLMFFCDSDIMFTQDFLGRCKQNAIMEEQVYYPIVFGQYNPSVVRKFSPVSRSKDLQDINKHTGHWIHYGFGMACMYYIDYRSVGGFSMTGKGWGGEDVELYQKHVRSKLDVFRAPDPGIIHRYHDRSCSPKLPEAQYRMCIDSSAETYGSKAQLAKKLAAMEKMYPKPTTTQPSFH